MARPFLEADFWPVENFALRLKTFSKRITSLQPVVRDELAVSQERIPLRIPESQRPESATWLI
jgi:hypothetical protein